MISNFNSKHQSTAKTVILLMVISVIAKFTSFFKDIILAYLYGASYISDAYIVANTVPIIIFSIIGIGISTSYIPLFSKIKKDSGVEIAHKFTNNVISLVLVFCIVIVIAVTIFTDSVIAVFASGFEGEAKILAIQLTRVSVIGIFFTAIVHIYKAYLQMYGNYMVPAISVIPMHFISAIAIVISVKTNVITLAIGIVLAVAIEFLYLYYETKKIGFRYSPGINFGDPNLKKMAFLALPVIIGSSTTQINQIVDRTLASQIAIGGISALNYAQKLDGFIKGVFIASIVTVLYPKVSKMAVDNNILGLKNSMKNAIVGVSIFIMPATVGAMTFSEQIVTLLFGRGAFDSAAVAMTSGALFFYSIGMIGFGLRTTLTKAFYSLQDTKTPMINSSIAMILNIILNIILSKYMGISGLALATSIAAIFAMVLMFISLRTKIGPFGMKQISISFLKILFASLVMGLISKLSFNYLTASLSQNLSLLLAIAVGAISYFVIIYFMKIEDVDIIVGAIKKKFGKGTAKG